MEVSKEEADQQRQSLQCMKMQQQTQGRNPWM